MVRDMPIVGGAVPVARVCVLPAADDVPVDTESEGHDPWRERMLNLGEFIRAQRTVAQLSLRDLAEQTGVSNAYLSQIERGLHEPSLRVLHAIAAALGVPLDLALTHAGLLAAEPADAGPSAGAQERVDTASTIMADRRLTGPQKYALLSIYRSFVGTNEP